MRKLSERYRRVLAWRSRHAMQRRRQNNANRRKQINGLVNARQRRRIVPPPPPIDLTSISSLGDVTTFTYILNNKKVDAAGYCMTPPADFCLDQNLDKTLGFIADFREVHFRNHRLPKPSGRGRKEIRNRRWTGTYTDIAAIRTITPAAALVLAAEYDRGVRRNRLGKRGIIDANKWKPEVARTLADIGFLDHLGADLPDLQQLDPNEPGVRMLRMRTGNHNEPLQAHKIPQALQELMDSNIDSALGHAIFGGLIEAMGNCVEHAYPKDHPFRYPTERGRWWMSGSVANHRELEVIFFDQGATIPGTLPHSRMNEAALRWLQRTLNLVGFDAADDGQRIRAAVEAGRSALSEQGRGHGLEQMRKLVNMAPSGSLRILSGRGRYIYNGGTDETADSLERSIGGTLVHWRFRL